MAGLIVRAICTPFELCFNCIGQGCARCSACIESACSKPFSCFVFSATCLNMVPLSIGLYGLMGHGAGTTDDCTKPVVAGVIVNSLLAVFHSVCAWWLFIQFNKPYLLSAGYRPVVDNETGQGDRGTGVGGVDDEEGSQSVPTGSSTGAIPEYRVLDRAYNLAMWSPVMLQ